MPVTISGALGRYAISTIRITRSTFGRGSATLQLFRIKTMNLLVELGILIRFTASGDLIAYLVITYLYSIVVFQVMLPYLLPIDLCIHPAALVHQGKFALFAS